MSLFFFGPVELDNVRDVVDGGRLDLKHAARNRNSPESASDARALMEFPFEWFRE